MSMLETAPQMPPAAEPGRAPRGPKGSEDSTEVPKSPQGNPGLPTSGETGFLRRFRAGFRKVARRTGIPSLSTNQEPRTGSLIVRATATQSPTRASYKLNRSPPPSPDFPPH